MKFKGYQRCDGKVGIRNKILILPASICASDTTRIIAGQVEGCVTFHNQLGCSQTKLDQQCTIDVMAGMAANPNVYGTIVISLGCENCQMNLVLKAIKERTKKPLKHYIIQENGGTIRTVERAVRAARDMAREASREQRVEVDLSHLILGTECGGSDPTSGLAANPLVGSLSDRFVRERATSVLSETTEFIGAEHILAKRGITEAVSKQIYEIVENYEKSMKQSGQNIRERNPSPGNKAGGITTLEEKSLGCIHKGGHAPIMRVFDYAEEIKEKGLVIMDTPGNDPISIAGMVAGGCQLIVFTTGRGTPTGNPIVPVIKITGNKITFNNMEDNIDFNASDLLYGKQTLDEMSENLYQEVIEVANGKKCKTEILGYQEMAIARVGVYRDNRNEYRKYYF